MITAEDILKRYEAKTKEARNEKILKFCEDGLRHTDVARHFGMSARQVRRLINRGKHAISKTKITL